MPKTWTAKKKDRERAKKTSAAGNGSESRGRGGGGKKRGKSEQDHRGGVTGRLRTKLRFPDVVEEAQQLEQDVIARAPPRGTNGSVRQFAELPISERTKAGLRKAGFTEMTDIQVAAISHGLAGRDVLGAARTGSGKTLAFVVPVLELLYRLRWTRQDGLGAVIVSPTRELALQIFKVLSTVGCYHDLSAGLVIGGKEVEDEKDRIERMNILVSTPGRLLHHLDETPNFRCEHLRILVLDEADRCLDLGFARTLNAIVQHLPKAPRRQTLLFSATQTKSVRDLARLSLQHPEFIQTAEAGSDSTTPTLLAQRYMTVALEDKPSVLFSFLRTHVRAKIIVFFATCRQTKFMSEAFRRLRVGMPVLSLSGKMKQMKRLAVYETFSDTRKDSGVGVALFATDIAARGLDFSQVDWVVQYDCPEDVDTYIHRVGRTARYVHGGQALMFLTESETPIVEAITQRKVPLKSVTLNPDKLVSIRPKMASLVVDDKELKHMAQKAFSSYLRRIFLQPNKQVFNVEAINSAEFAYSLGLSVVPTVHLVKKGDKLKEKNFRMTLVELEKNESTASALEALNEKRRHLADEEMRPLQEAMEESDDDDDDDGFLVPKNQRASAGTSTSTTTTTTTTTSVTEEPSLDELMKEQARNRKKLKLKQSVPLNSRILFDEEGKPVKPKRIEDEQELEEKREEFQNKMRGEMRMRDREDLAREKERRRQVKLQAKQKARDAMRQALGLGAGGGGGGDDDDDDEEEEDGGRGGVMLASNSEGESDDDDGEEEEEEEEADGFRARHGGALDEDYDMVGSSDLSDDSGDEREIEPLELQRKRAIEEEGDDDEDDEEEEGRGRRKPARGGKVKAPPKKRAKTVAPTKRPPAGGKPVPASLADQEALALRLLGQGM